MTKCRVLMCLLFLLGGAMLRAQTVTTFEGIDASQLTNPGLDIDPNGAVGTKQFLEWVNVAYQAYDKVTLAPVWSTPQPGTTPFKSTGLSSCFNITGDGVVLFDRLASRWVIGARSVSLGVYYYCIAVSNTDDLSSPSLVWFTYATGLNAILGKNTLGNVYFPDWPKLATWSDAYYLTIDQEDTNQNFREVGSIACALDRTNMLAGAVARKQQCFQTGVVNGSVSLSHSLIPSDVDGTNPPPAGRDQYLFSIMNPPNDGVSTTSGIFNIWDFHVDWANPANSTFTQSTQSVAPYTPGCYNVTSPAVTICVPEPSSSASGKFQDSVGDRFMPRVAYRNFGSHESFLFSHTIQTGTGTSRQTGLRWYEMRGAGTPTLFQTANVSPDKSLFRFMPSIAQDSSGEAAIGYSVSSGLTHPGIRASWWNLASLTAPSEFSILSGVGDQENASQWGDYTSMTVDPVDGCTFWYVNEYFAQNQIGGQHNWNTRISSFKLPGCGAASLLPASGLTFGSVALGNSSAPQSAVLINGQNVTLNISSIGLAGANAADFTESHTCGTSLPAGANCSISVTFTPKAVGARSATVTVADDAGNSPQTVSVKGTAVNPVTFNPGFLNFGGVTVGTTSNPMNTVLTNRQNVPLHITNISITGLNAGDFSQTNNCPASVAAGATCIITVTFKPSATGTRTGNVKVMDDALTNPQLVKLNGTGQ